MKKLIAILLTLTHFVTKSQNNGGFENWVTSSNGLYEDPVDWQTLNFSTQFGNPVSAFKVSGVDKYSGNYALKITSVHLTAKIISQLPDTIGLVFNGKVTISPPSYQIGSVFNGRPQKLTFYSKYIPVGIDTGLVGLILYRQLPGGIRDTIGEGKIDILQNGIYSYYQINIHYRNSATPDSSNIYFQSSNRPNAKRVGSSLYIDEVAFSAWAGIEKYDSYASKIKVYPNPASNLLSINVLVEDAAIVEIINMQGQKINTCSIQNYNATINTEGLSHGVYFYNILNKKNKILTNGKFIIAK